MPITLKKGTLRSPEFKVKHRLYVIEIQADNALPRGQLDCLMGVYMFKNPNHCEMFGYHLALEAKWKLLAGGQVVDHGIVKGRDDQVEFTAHHTNRWIGQFVGQKHKKYVLEMTFTRNGSALRVADPHIVIDLKPGLYM